MGRAPCCDKANVKKGPWSPEEDAKLKAYIEQHGTGGNWIALPQKIGLKRCGKSCRLRWLNYLRPNIKHGGFSEEEDNIICSLYISIGSRWSIIAAQLPGRTDNDIKNYWNTRLKKKLLGKQRKEQAARRASLKQEIKREISENFMAPVSMNQLQAPYWPELPAVLMPAVLDNYTTTQDSDHNFLDQESIKNLLVKLGGRFSDNYQESIITSTTNYALEGSCTTQDQVFTNSSTGPMNSSYGVNEAGPDLIQRLDCFAVELNDMMSANSRQLDGLENFVYGMEMTNCSSNGARSSVESSSWENITSLQPYPQLLASDYENCLPQDSTLEGSRYYRGQ